MKQTENNEMDLLLRGLARRQGAISAAPEDESAMHLDADELNSYAEQALPAAARARYTTHLADCASCRKIISELVSAAGTNITERSVSPKTSVSLWHKIGALFSPGSLRYGVPALALFAFIAVGLFVIRQQTQPEFVAQNQPMESRDAIAPKQAGSPAEPQKAAANDEPLVYDSQTRIGKDRDNLAKSGDTPETSTKPTTTDSVSVAADRDASAGKAAGAVAQPSYAPEPAAPPPPKPQTTGEESRTEVLARQKKEADKNADEPAREQEGARARRNDSQNQVAVGAEKRSPAVQSEERMRTPDATLASAAGRKAKDDEAETRTVSGRRFRRQGGVWIDTGYQPSMATTTVARDSEQFRALVADEAGIRAIASQLPGEVVVVWKGRAYRIR
ncbi:MAG: hypothetical protein ND866_23010 [Pyrinomonadaceae bacterium]|nr:hypothetical protein [Pyrinomonadaceae bacterium]